MKMVMVFYRHSLDQDIRRVLKDFNLKAFTEAPKVVGIGEAECRFDALTWPGHHAIILSALDDIQADRVIRVLKEFRDYMVRLQDGAKIPLRVFTFPCERVI